MASSYTVESEGGKWRSVEHREKKSKKYAIFYSKWLDPSEEEEEDDMSEEDELVELPGGLDQLEAIAEEYAKREERWRFFVVVVVRYLFAMFSSYP